MRYYKAFYRGKSIEFLAESKLAAQTKAAAIFKAKRAWEVAVVLADVPVNTASL